MNDLLTEKGTALSKNAQNRRACFPPGGIVMIGPNRVDALSIASLAALLNRTTIVNHVILAGFHVCLQT